MQNTFSISFSDSAFQIVHSTQEGENSQFVAYEQNSFDQSVSIDALLKPQTLTKIVDRINQFKQQQSIEEAELVFALPFNYAHVKQVVFPAGTDKKEKRSIIEWEMEAVVHEPIKNYKMSVLNQRVHNEQYTQAMVVAINKTIIKELLTIAEKCNLTLASVVLNCFSLESVLDQANFKNETLNQLFLKVGTRFVEHHFFVDGQYHLSAIDLINSSESRSFDDLLVESSKERIKQIANQVQQTGKNSQFEMFVYGDTLLEETVNALKSGLSLPVNYAQAGNGIKVDGYKYIEAWGAVI